MVFRLVAFLSLLFVPSWSRAAEDLMDEYLTLPGSYTFVRRAPEGAVPQRVQIAVFEDFLCPACYHTATDIIPTLKKKYGDRLETRFYCYPFIAPESRLPARAYAIAQEMGLGEQMQQALFHARFEQQIDTSSRAGLAKVADNIGLSPDLLLNQLDGNGGNAEVDRNIAQGDIYRLDAVPGVIFDGWIKATEVSQENFAKIIDGLLERKNKTNAKATKNVRQ